MNRKILIVDDDRSMCEMLETTLTRRGFTISWCTSAKEASERLHAQEVDVLLTDLNMPEIGGIELCKDVAMNRPDVPVVVITAFGSLATAIEAMRSGAYDFVTKPLDVDLLALSLERALRRRGMSEKIRILSERVASLEPSSEIIGDSGPMRALFDQLPRIAASDATVLIVGESGTGKELITRAIHAQSPRADAPFLAINCAALPETLLESELFGHKRGAFTDAKQARKGVFLQADGGTFLLDEVGDLPLSLQPKLLRAIEERTLRPIGADHDVAFDVRIIAATNKNLETAVEQGSFREDLYYRLDVIQLELPPLRARGTDVLLIADHFIKLFAKQADKAIGGLSSTAARKILGYHWPGNIRELRNAIERAVAMTLYDKISVEDLPEKLRSSGVSHALLPGDDPMQLISAEEMERRYILHVMRAVGDNRTLAARILEIDRKTLYRKLQQYAEKGATPT